jgi:hypothetical protein
MADVIVPTVHLNGTSAESLIAQLHAVDKALNDAVSAMSLATPHDRDYYVQDDPDAGPKARLANWERQIRIEAIRHEIQEIMQGVYDQTTERRRALNG